MGLIPRHDKPNGAVRFPSKPAPEPTVPFPHIHSALFTMSLIQPDPRLFSTLPIKPPPRTQALSSETFALPPCDGSLFLHELYDWHYEHSPNHPLFQYATEGGEITTITMSKVAPAIHRAGRYVQSVVSARGVNTSKRPVVGVLSASGELDYSNFGVYWSLLTHT
ncbi:hypothetical protein EIP86_007082 [Pleurotus ostreatoroseus]|nr:hypothetical protein EIP86_007082 [Pleurotus ostreatoroseus]